MKKPQNKPYYFRKRKAKAYIEVRFAHIPGRWFSTGTKDMTEAVLFAERQLKADSLSKPAYIPTLSEFSKDFFMKDDPGSFRDLDRKYKRKRAPKYYDKAQAILDNHILPRFGNIIVTAIMARSIEDWLPDIKLLNGKEAADNTKNKILDVFRYVMDGVKREGYRDDNPAREVSSISAEYEEREPLPPDQAELLFPPEADARIRIWHGLMWAVYFSILYDTGMRPGEIAALRVCDIYQTPQGLAVGTSRAVNTDTKKIQERVKTTGKGLAGRFGLLYDDTAELVIRYIREEGLVGRAALFHAPRNKNKPLGAETSNKHFKQVMTEHGFYHEGVVQYCVRHTYETERRGDMSDSILAVSMGHTKLRDDYDHRTVPDMIMRLDRERDKFFANRERRGRSDVVSISELMDEKKPAHR